MIGHTQLPWHAEDDRVVFGKGLLVAECYGGTTKESIANAAFIVKAVNNHETLVKALEEQREYLAGKATSAFLNGFPADDEAQDRIERITQVLNAVGGSGGSNG